MSRKSLASSFTGVAPLLACAAIPLSAGCPMSCGSHRMQWMHSRKSLQTVSSPRQAITSSASKSGVQLMIQLADARPHHRAR